MDKRTKPAAGWPSSASCSLEEDVGFYDHDSSHSEAQIIKTGLGVKLLVVYYSTINLVAEFISRKKSTLLVL